MALDEALSFAVLRHTTPLSSQGLPAIGRSLQASIWSKVRTEIWLGFHIRLFRDQIRMSEFHFTVNGGAYCWPERAAIVRWEL